MTWTTRNYVDAPYESRFPVPMHDVSCRMDAAVWRWHHVREDLDLKPGRVEWRSESGCLYLILLYLCECVKHTH